MIQKYLLALGLVLITTVNVAASITRNRIENFQVEPDSSVEVKINGGAINVKVGPPGQVHVELIQVVNTHSEKEADERIAQVQPIIEQKEHRVRVVVKSDGSHLSFPWLHTDHSVHYTVNLIVPAKSNLDLDTGGGAIVVADEMQGELRAHTSGGSITVAGSLKKIDLDTSGGSISVDRVTQQVHVNTSGGSIHIGYVGPDVVKVDADTSGGSISIGLDPAGNYDVNADTSGGSVSIRELRLESYTTNHSHAEGKVNRGGAKVRAYTSGGNIDVHAAQR